MRLFGNKNKNLKYNLNVSLLLNGENHIYLQKDYPSLQEVADELNISYDSVYNIFKGRHKYNKINECKFYPKIKIIKILP